MSCAELLTRCRQELQKSADVMLATCGYTFAAAVRAGAPGGNFFFDSSAVTQILDAVCRNLPNRAEEIVAEAERCCRHDFDLLGYHEIEYGPEIDWHHDAVNGKTAPRRAFFKIPYLDFAQCGDVKVTWELNRHQHFLTLAKAYRLTGEARFVEEIRAQFGSWQSANPYPSGLNWASSLEVAMRSLSWLWTYFLLESTASANDVCSALRRALGINARHIERYLSTYFSPNSHLLGEGLALFFIGTICTEFASAARWQKSGWGIVLREAERQVRADGMHFEQSTYYHVYHVDFLLHAMLLARANAIAIPASFERTLLKTLNALCQLSRDQTVPKFGDEDGGRLFDPRRNSNACMTDPLSTAAVLFGRSDFKAARGRLCEETLWLLGAAAAEEWDRIGSASRPCESFALASSGIYVMAGGGELIADAGPHGALHGGHGHADALSIYLRANGKELLVDPGTGAYAAAPRQMFRTTAMHNTLQVDDRDQAEISGPFKWASQPAARAGIWFNEGGFDLLQASHEGYLRLEQPVLHTRWIFSARSGFWLVRDVVRGAGEHSLALHWHFAPELRPGIGEGAWICTANDGSGLALLTTGPPNTQTRPRQSLWSPVYGIIESAWVLEQRTISAPPAEFCTLLLPIAPAQRAIGTLIALSSCSQGVAAYRYLTPVEEYRIYFGTSPEWAAGDCSSDARFLCRKITAENDEWMSFGASWVSVEGRVLALSDGRTQVARSSVAVLDAEGSQGRPLRG